MQHFTASSPYQLKFETPLSLHTSGSLTHTRVAVKDLFHIAGLATSAGNPDWLLSHLLPTKTSPVITALLDNGASVVGKTITDELAYSLNGQNIHYGTPINSKNSDRLPGGSSSGSAAAVANGSADVGLGTDTGGSIRVPASYNGLYGLRPTHGIISTEQMVGLAPDFDTVGWLTRDLSTLSEVANVLLPKHEPILVSNKPKIAFSKALNDSCEHQPSLSQITDKLAGAQISTIHDISDRLNYGGLEKVAHAFRILQGAQIWATHGNWISKQQPVFAPDIAARFNWCQTISAAQVTSAKTIQAEFRALLEQIFSEFDFLLIPTTPGSAPLLSADEQYLADYRNQLLSLTCIAGMGGLPQLHIPLVDHSHLAMGLSLIAARHRDHQVIHVAHTLLEWIK